MKSFRAFVITVSDRSASGERKDLSGPTAVEKLKEAGFTVTGYEIVPDGIGELSALLEKTADEDLADLVLTTGGTGLSLRDLTPEATLSVADRTVPGIAEYIRMKSAEKTAHAMLSRGTAATRRRTLIVNLPGSPKAVSEVLDFLLPPLMHGLDILRGTGTD